MGQAHIISNMVCLLRCLRMPCPGGGVMPVSSSGGESRTDKNDERENMERPCIFTSCWATETRVGNSRAICGEVLG